MLLFFFKTFLSLIIQVHVEINIGEAPRVNLVPKTKDDTAYVTIETDDPTSDQSLCYATGAESSSEAAAILCDGQTGQCDLTHAKKYVAPIPIDRTTTIRAVSCILNHAPSPITTVVAEVFAEPPLLQVLDTGGGASGGDITIGMSAPAGPSGPSSPGTTTSLLPPILCYILSTADKVVTPTCSEDGKACGTDTLTFDPIAPLILSGTTTIVAVSCQEGRSTSPLRKMEVVQTATPTITATGRPPSQTPVDVVIRHTSSGGNPSSGGGHSWVCYRTDGLDASCPSMPSNSFGVCGTPEQQSTASSVALVVHGDDTMVSAKACSNMNDAVGTDSTSGDVTHSRIGVEGNSVTYSVRFAKIPRIRDDGPRTPLVTIEIDIVAERRRARRLGQKTLCYTLGTNSGDPTCNERSTCGEESHVYDGKFSVDITTVIRAIQCGQPNEFARSFPSNVTSKTVTVLPPVVETPTDGGSASTSVVAQGPSASEDVQSTDGDANNEVSSECVMWGPLCWWWWILIAILLCLCCCCIFIVCWYRKKQHMTPLHAKKSMPYTGEPDADDVQPDKDGTYGIAVCYGSGVEMTGMTSNPMTPTKNSERRGAAGVPTVALKDVGDVGDALYSTSTSKEQEEKTQSLGFNQSLAAPPGHERESSLLSRHKVHKRKSATTKTNKTSGGEGATTAAVPPASSESDKRRPPPKHYTSFTRSKNKSAGGGAAVATTAAVPPASSESDKRRPPPKHYTSFTRAKNKSPGIATPAVPPSGSKRYTTKMNAKTAHKDVIV